MIPRDYLLDDTGLDWPRILRGWRSLLPSEYAVWFANRFGDAIIVFEDGSVHYLDVGEADLRRIAGSREEFSELLKITANATDWLLTPLVDACRQAGMSLGSGRCYGFKIPPVLGGRYELANFATKTVAEYHGFMAAIHAQVKDMPDGAQIRLAVEKPN